MTFPKLSQVHVKISVPKGIKFVGHPGKHHLTRKKCVAPGEAKPTSIVLSFNELGLSNITGTHNSKQLLEGLLQVFLLLSLSGENSYFPIAPVHLFPLLPTWLLNLICCRNKCPASDAQNVQTNIRTFSGHEFFCCDVKVGPV